jgi:2,4-dienoyl-CoA reductase (NADPH2)
LFRNLFKPIKLGEIRVKNRITLPGLIMGLATEDGEMTQELIDFYEIRAKGDTGLIVVGGAYPERRGKGYYGMLGIDRDGLIEGYKRLTRRLKGHGAITVLQILHAGRYARSSVSGLEPVAPSSVPCKLTGETPRELTHEEVITIRENFVKAIRRAYLAGFDGVELHAGMGYLLNQFLSPFTNRRMDEYGGNLENRCRLLLEIIEKAKKEVPSTFLLGCRISMDEFVEGGNTIEEGRFMVKKLDEVGVHFISLVVGWHESRVPLITAEVPIAGYVNYAEEAKKLTNVPIIYATRVKDPYTADRLIGEGKTDMVAMGRALIADPEFPMKAKRGDVEGIRPCISCSHCLSTLFNALILRRPLVVECSVNPRIGKEMEVLNKAEKPKRVLIIGAGPAGLEAAVTLKKRGHDVILAEREEELGGMLRVASVPPFKHEISDLIRYYEVQVKRYEVEMILNKEVSLEFIEEVIPDEIIVATGAVHKELDIPGSDKPFVIDALEVLADKKKLEGDIIIIGGGEVGLETADYLSEDGRCKVTIIELMDRAGRDVELVERGWLFKRLKDKGVRVLTKSKALQIEEDGIVIERDGKSFSLHANYVINATGMVPNKEIGERLKEKGFKVTLIGDCLHPRRIIDAIKEGFEVGSKI